MAGRDYAAEIDKKRRKKAEEETASSATVSKSRDYASELDVRRYAKTAKIDTLGMDLQSLSTTLNSLSAGWQTPETMKNTRNAIQSMKTRLNAYESYRKITGSGTDLNDLASGYQEILEDWDERAKAYGKYDSKESYDNAMKLAEEALKRREGMKTANLEEHQAEIDRLEGFKSNDYFKEFNEASKIRQAAKSASGRNGYVYNPKGNKIEDRYNTAKANLDKFLASEGYVDAEALQKDIVEKTQYKNEAQVIQDRIALENEIKADADFAKYVSRGEALGDEKEDGWLVSDMQRKNQVAYLRNNPEAMKTFEEAAKAANGASWGTNERLLTQGSLEYKAAKYGTDEQLKNYYAYLGKGEDEKAQKYLESIEEDLNLAMGTAKAEEQDTTSKRLLYSITSGLDRWEQNTLNAFNTSDYYIPSSPTQVASGIVRDELWDAGPKILDASLGQIVYDLGTTTANMAPSILASALTGSPMVGIGVMGVSAAGGAYQEKLNQGWDKDQARVYSTAIGIAEGSMQYALGGIGELGGKLSGKSIQAMATGIDNALGRFFAVMPIKMSSEFTEESLQEVIAPFIENLALGYAKNNWSDVDLQEVAYSGMLGALSAGLLESGGTAVDVFGENHTAKNVGASIRGNERAGDVFDIASLTPQESDAYNLYTAYANKGVNADNASDLQLGRLFVNSDKATQETLYSRKATLKEKADALELKGKLGKVGTENKVAKRAKALTADTQDKHTLGEGISIQGIKFGEDTKIVTNEGEMSVDKVALPEREAQLVAHAETMTEDMANLFVAQYDGNTDVDTYADSFNLATKYAENAFPQETILEHKGVLTERQVAEIYKATRTAVVQETQKAIDNITQKHSKGTFLKGTFDDAIIDYKSATTDGSKVNWSALTSRQRSAIKFAKMFSKATGVNIRFIQSAVEDGKRVGKNGSYDPNTNIIEIDVYAGIDGQYMTNAIIPTLSHEVTHWMKAKSPTIYEAIKNELVPFLAEKSGKTIDGLVKKEMERIKENHSDIDVTPEYAMDELVARACEDMLTNSNQAKSFLAKMTYEERNNFVGKIQKTLKNLIEWADELLSYYKSKSKEAELLRQYRAELKKVSKMWDEMLVSAVESNQALQKEGITGEELAKAENNADVQLSVRMIIGESGTNYGIGVYLDSDLLTGLTEEERRQMVKEYVVSELAGEHFIAYDRSNNAVDVRLATTSEKFKNEKGKKKKVLKELYNKYNKFVVKQEAIVLIDELIASANFNGAFPARHKHDWLDNNGKNDWDSWNVYIQEKNKSVWEATLNIANTTNGEKILYDIDPIKMVEQASKSATSTTKAIVPQNGTKSQEQNSDRDSSYMDAVNNGDMETAQKMVDDFAESKFNNSKVRDANGKLLKVFHGTTNEFTVFDRQFANIEGDFGKGYYFTSNEYDVEANYANEDGPDLKNKIARLVDRMEYEDEYADLSYGEREEIARQKFITSEPQTITAYLNMENPVYITPDENGTFLDYTENYDEETDEYGEPEGLLLDFIEALKDNSYDYAYNDVDFSFLYEYAYDNGGVYASDAVKTIKHRIVDELADENGDLAINEVIRLAFEQIGFDGIIDTSVYYKFRNMDGMDSGTTHYIVFDSAQIKSAEPVTYDNDGKVIPLSQRFDESNDDIRYADRNNDGYAKAQEMQIEINQLTNQIHELEASDGFKSVMDVLSEAIKNNDTEKGISAYNKWLDESGYSKVKERRDSLQKDLEKLKKGLHEAYVQNALDEEKKAIEKSGLSEADYFRKQAVKEFGYTPFFYDAGYITPNGKMLNFSGEKGQHYGSRGQDHRGISVVYANTSGSEAMIRFMSDGNIRIMAESPGIDISSVVEPTKEQYATIRKFVREYANKEYFNIDITDADGHTIGNYEYEGKISAERVVNDIKYFFESGTTREQSSISQFLSDRMTETVYDKMGETKRLEKETARLKKDLGRLRERLSIEGKVTGGTAVLSKDTDAVARHIRKIADSTFDTDKLSTELKDLYTYVRESSLKGTWNDDAIFAKAYELAEGVLTEAKPKTTPNDYAKFLLKEIRSKRIRLSDTQIQEAKNVFGDKYRNAFWGKITIANDGISLDSQWQEWASTYPDFFKADVNEGDQITELHKIYDDLRDVSEIVQEYDAEEQTRWLAEEIINKRWTLPIRFTIADKYDAQIKALNFEHRQAMKEMRDDREQKLKEQHQTDKARYKELVQKVRDRKDAEIAEAKKLGKERLDKYREAAERKTVIQSILSKTTSLSKKLLTNDKDVHIPEGLKPVVTKIIDTIDFSSRTLLGMAHTRKDYRGMPTKMDAELEKRFSRVRAMVDEDVSLYQAISDALELFQQGGNIMSAKTDGTTDMGLAILDADLEDKLKTLQANAHHLEKKFGDAFVLQQMSLEDLKTLNSMVHSINHWAIESDKMRSLQRTKSLREFALKTVEEDAKMKEYTEYIEGIESVRKFLAWDNLQPAQAFDRLGETGKEMYNALLDAMEKQAFNEDEIEKFTKKLFKGHDIKKWQTETKTFNLQLWNGEKKTVELPISFVMNLYCVSKQEDAKRHLFAINDDGSRYNDGGGMTIASYTDKSKKGTKGVWEKIKVKKDTHNTVLVQKNIDQITSVLTKEQKAVADAMQKFMNETGSDWGNAVSEVLYGIKKFDIDDYFPMTVSPTTLKRMRRNGTEGIHFYSILNYGFTKARNPDAKQSIEIGDIFDVFARHMKMMAIYNAWAVPVYDMVRWFNFTGKDFNGNEIGVTKSIQDAFGESAVNYIETLMEDLNGQHESSRLGFIQKIISNTKIALVGNSISVALLQPTAIVKALNCISPKYISKSLLYIKDFGAKRGRERAKEHNGIALLKSKGRFEMGVSTDETRRLLNQRTFMDKRKENSLWLAGKMDELTFGMLWNACEFETKEKRKDLKVGSDEYFKVVSNRLRDIIVRTQVVDTPLTKSHLMRSGDTGAKSITMFASEITSAYNLLTEAFYSASIDKKRYGKEGAFKRNIGKIARAMSVYTLTSTTVALFETLVANFRHDDDEEKEFEDYLKQYFSNFFTDLNLLGKIPYVKDAVSNAQGFTSSRTETLWMESAVKAVQYAQKAFEGKEGAAEKSFVNLLKALSDLSGLPGYNQYRDAVATLHFFDILDAEDIKAMYDDLFN